MRIDTIFQIAMVIWLIIILINVIKSSHDPSQMKTLIVGGAFGLLMLMGITQVFTIFIPTTPDLSGAWELTLSNGHTTNLTIFDNEVGVLTEGLVEYREEGQQVKIIKAITEDILGGKTLTSLTLVEDSDQVGYISLTNVSSNLLEGTLLDNDGNTYHIRLENLAGGTTDNRGAIIPVPIIIP